MGIFITRRPLKNTSLEDGPAMLTANGLEIGGDFGIKWNPILPHSPPMTRGLPWSKGRPSGQKTSSDAFPSFLARAWEWRDPPGAASPLSFANAECPEGKWLGFCKVPPKNGLLMETGKTNKNNGIHKEEYSHSLCYNLRNWIFQLIQKGGGSKIGLISNRRNS